MQLLLFEKGKNTQVPKPTNLHVTVYKGVLQGTCTCNRSFCPKDNLPKVVLPGRKSIHPMFICCFLSLKK